MGQSSNDVFPTAMHMAAVDASKSRVVPSVHRLRDAFEKKSETFRDIVKIGRTHLQDAVPLTLGQEFSGYTAQLDHGLQHIEASLPHLHELALGGTAVGTGLNAHPEFAVRAAKKVAELTNRHPFFTAPNKFEALAAHDALVHAHGTLKTLAASLTQNSQRHSVVGLRPPVRHRRDSSFPRTNRAALSCRAKSTPPNAKPLTMICAQVFGNDVAINYRWILWQFRAQRL